MVSDGISGNGKRRRQAAMASRDGKSLRWQAAMVREEMANGDGKPRSRRWCKRLEATISIHHQQTRPELDGDQIAKGTPLKLVPTLIFIFQLPNSSSIAAAAGKTHTQNSFPNDDSRIASSSWKAPIARRRIWIII